MHVFLVRKIWKMYDDFPFALQLVMPLSNKPLIANLTMKVQCVFAFEINECLLGSYNVN